MTKRDLVIQISEETGQVQQKVLAVVQRMLDLISESLAARKTVELRNFGVFEVKVRKARIGRNPNRPEKDVAIPQRAVVKFKPGKEMREAVLKAPLRKPDRPLKKRPVRTPGLQNLPVDYTPCNWPASGWTLSRAGGSETAARILLTWL